MLPKNLPSKTLQILCFSDSGIPNKADCIVEQTSIKLRFSIIFSMEKFMKLASKADCINNPVSVRKQNLANTTLRAAIVMLKGNS